MTRSPRAWSLVVAILAGMALLRFMTTRAEAASPTVPTDALKGAVTRALPLIQRASAHTLKERECFTCHQGAHPTIALNEAWRRGFEIDEDNLGDQLVRAYAELVEEQPRFKDGFSVSGTTDGPGHALWMLYETGWKPDAITAGTTDFFVNYEKDEDHWTTARKRPPTAGSPFTATFLVLQGIKYYESPASRELSQLRVEAALNWLRKQQGRETEDTVTRLRALHLMGGSKELTRSIAKQLMSEQHEDGGWSQMPQMNSDAYATSTVLAALHDCAVLKPKDEVYQRGLKLLLKTQLEDGSWHVVKRTRSFQQHFESGFPHERDQFISCTASCWAVYALLQAMPEKSGSSKRNFLSKHPQVIIRMKAASAAAKQLRSLAH